MPRSGLQEKGDNRGRLSSKNDRRSRSSCESARAKNDCIERKGRYGKNWNTKSTGTNKPVRAVELYSL